MQKNIIILKITSQLYNITSLYFIFLVRAYDLALFRLFRDRRKPRFFTQNDLTRRCGFLNSFETRRYGVPNGHTFLPIYPMRF